MTYDQLVAEVVADSRISTVAYLPELLLVVTIAILLLLRVCGGTWIKPSTVAALGTAAALVAAWLDWQTGSYFAREHLGDEIFTGMLVYDRLTLFWRLVLIGFTLLFIWLTRLTGVPDLEDGPDIYTLVLSSTLGFCTMATSQHLMMVFLGLELASVPVYVLAGLQKNRRKSSEAALKFAIFGVAAASVFLYGLSLVAGVLGSVHIPTMAERLATIIADPAAGDRTLVLVLGAVMIFAGLAFKLSAVPFHFWCPDVFEGATAEIDGFLSVASKAAALALLIRLVLGFGGEAWVTPAVIDTQVATTAAADLGSTAVSGDSVAAAEPAAAEGDRTPVAAAAAAPASIVDKLAPVRSFLVAVLSLMAAATMTFGNLAAYGQTNIKRLLAYSTIAHAGYMIVPVAAAVAMLSSNPSGARQAISAVGLYVVTYVFMNLGAFAIVAFIRNQIHSEEIADYAGLVKSCPGLVACLVIILISLVGLPPLAGFFAKYSIFAAAAEAQLWSLVVLGVLNTVVSLFYYLRVVKVMTIDREPADRLPIELPLLFSPTGRFALLLTAPLVLLILGWDQLARWTQLATLQLFP